MNRRREQVGDVVEVTVEETPAEKMSHLPAKDVKRFISLTDGPMSLQEFDEAVRLMKSAGIKF